MQVDQIAGFAFDRLLGRAFRRALIAIATAACIIVAVDQFTAAGSLALETQYGALLARLIIGATYCVLSIAGFAVFAMTRNRHAVAIPAIARQQEMYLAMLVEAVMLGFALARKANKTH